MRKSRKTGRSFFVISVLAILFCIMLWGRTGIAAEDADQSGNREFDIDAQLISLDDHTRDIQLTIGNSGADWEGTVRVQMDASYSYNSSDCAYDTVLSLPQGSTKQFVVRIPKESIEYIGGAMNISLLDKKFNTVAEKGFKRLLLEDADVLTMGILSDSYQSLTYLDMGGEGIYYGGNDLPVKLLEVDRDNLTGTLDSLIYLVIDNYDTGILPDETVDSIKRWVSDGGMLIVGTGRRAEDTLRGLDFLDIECLQVNEPGESAYNTDYAAGLSQLPLADLQDLLAQYHVDRDSMIMITTRGDGAMEVVPYALSDLGRPDRVIEDWEGFAWELLQNVNNYTRIQYDSGNQRYYDEYYILRRIFRTFGNGSSRLNFGVLKWIVIIYVIFVGPILYLILRLVKKRDWYWIAVPVTTLVGILLVYLAGHGFEVVNTRVYSVTVENLSDQNTDAVTYMHCYDAGHKEWELQLAEDYEYIGPILVNYYSSDGKYHHRICKEGERISFGLNPSAGFEDCYFMAGNSRKKGTGSISSDIEISAQREITGTVTNETNRDFKYFAVIVDNVLFVYENLPAGESCNLENVKYTSRQEGYDTAMEAFQRGYMSGYYYEKERKDADIIAALGTGVSVVGFAEDPRATVIIGVTENWDRTVDDDCTETSYGCLYSVQ